MLLSIRGVGEMGEKKTRKKCSEGCSCGRHKLRTRTKCPVGCNCLRHERTAEHAKNLSVALKGRKSWCKGLTKETNESLRILGNKISLARQLHPWSSWIKGLGLNDPRVLKLALKNRKYKRVQIACAQCGKEYEIPGYKTKKFCSRSCYAQWRLDNCTFNGIVGYNPWSVEPNMKHSDDWVNHQGYPQRFKEVRPFILAIDRHLCQLCGASDFEGKKLAVHHIDENKRNNTPWNLITVCNVCHRPLHNLVGRKLCWSILWERRPDHLRPNAFPFSQGGSQIADATTSRIVPLESLELFASKVHTKVLSMSN